MFDLFSWSHIIILLAAALIIVGPKDLPRMMHMAGKWAGKARAMASEFRRSFDEMARQAELDELRKEIEDLKKHNPLTAVQEELNRPVENSVAIDAAAAQDSAPAEFAGLEAGPEPRSGEFEITQAPESAVQQPAPLAPAEIEPPLP
jgi:sec-independent protein translocase protein TatB